MKFGRYVTVDGGGNLCHVSVDPSIYLKIQSFVACVLKGQGIFSLEVNTIIRLQVTLQPRYAKNVIRYAFMLKGSQSHVFA